MSSENGAFELLRADRGGATRPLIPIPIAPNGYGILYLKNAVSAHATIYVCSIQSELSQVLPNDSFGMTQVFNSKCMNCLQEIPVEDMKRHAEDCCGESSKHKRCGSSLSKPGSSTDLAHLLQEIWENKKRRKLKKPLNLFQRCRMKNHGKTSWNLCFQLMFTYDSIESLVADFSSRKDGDKSYTLCIHRDDLWRGALGFYKKALSDKTLLMKDLIIVFKGEEGLDAGAMEVEYFCDFTY